MCYAVQGAPDTSKVYRACNAGTYSSGDAHADGVAYVLADMETVTPNHVNYDYYTMSPCPTAAIYGHATCNSALFDSDCGICVSYAKSQILADCSNCLGVNMVLRDCSMRYDSYSFTD
ncbi:antifungal protein ginkbilobin-like protein [Syzygium oleosum]|uniref:antifungal protein ginkbilobin-like protein n=1 Tax=Syzygium oleosum TaxID=219896 RepID=UPI0024BA845D|nr:antifungal protein ginkbilobin-like protein [Syzygium oleosum]